MTQLKIEISDDGGNQGTMRYISIRANERTVSFETTDHEGNEREPSFEMTWPEIFAACREAR